MVVTQQDLAIFGPRPDLPNKIPSVKLLYGHLKHNYWLFKNFQPIKPLRTNKRVLLQLNLSLIRKLF